MNAPTVKEEPCPMCGERDRRLCDCLVVYDWRGTQVRYGSTVVYAVAQSSAITMKEGVVERIEHVEDPWRAGKWKPVLYVKSGRSHSSYQTNGSGKVVKITAVEQITVIPANVCSCPDVEREGCCERCPS